MTRTASSMLPLGTLAPNFSIEDVTTGEQFKLAEAPRYSATVVMFICNHCPYVKHVNSELTRLARNTWLRKSDF